MPFDFITAKEHYMQTTVPGEIPIASLYLQTLHELAELVGLEPFAILSVSSVSASTSAS